MDLAFAMRVVFCGMNANGDKEIPATLYTLLKQSLVYYM